MADPIISPGHLPAPGWYPDPEQVETQRYWTGEAWTDQRAPMPAEKRKSDVGLGIALAFLVPLVGFIFGIAMLVRGFASGVVVMLLSVISTVFWVGLLLAI